MDVRLKTIKRDEFTISIPDESASVGDLKKLVEETKGSAFPAEHTKLICAGKVLKDSDAVKDVYQPSPMAFMVVMVNKPKETAAASTAASKPTAAAEQPKGDKGDGAGTSTPSTASVLPAAAVPMTGEAPGARGQAAGRTATNPEVESTIAQIMAMGYDRPQVEQALQASFMDMERAVSYLLDGIPDTVLAAQQQDMQAVSSGEDEGGSAAGGLEFMRNVPEFIAMRRLVQSDPQLLPDLLQRLGAENPELMRRIQENEEAFLNMINQPIEAPASEAVPTAGSATNPAPPSGGQPAQGAAQPPPPLEDEDARMVAPGVLAVTVEERDAISRLAAMGFEEQLCIQAYFACDKDENSAANFLLQQMEDMWDEPQQPAGGGQPPAQ